MKLPPLARSGVTSRRPQPALEEGRLLEIVASHREVADRGVINTHGVGYFIDLRPATCSAGDEGKWLSGLCRRALAGDEHAGQRYETPLVQHGPAVSPIGRYGVNQIGEVIARSCTTLGQVGSAQVSGRSISAIRLQSYCRQLHAGFSSTRA